MAAGSYSRFSFSQTPQFPIGLTEPKYTQGCLEGEYLFLLEIA